MAADIALWVNAEPFCYGALPVAPHPKLTLSNIKKIVIYGKNKTGPAYPNLSYSLWKHIACNKLHLSEELAWMYFSSCLLLTGVQSPAERCQWQETVAAASSQAEKEELRGKLNISLYRFVLYLYIQQLFRVSLRASLVAGEEWPTLSGSASSDLDGRSTPRGAKTLDDHSHLVFVQTHLAEMLELLSEGEDTGGSQTGGSAALVLKAESMAALGFLLSGSIDTSHKILMPIQDIAKLQTVQMHSGYSKISNSFSVRMLQNWIKDNLEQNPFGISACISSGTRLAWPLAGEEARAEGSAKRGKIATNASIVPREHIPGNKIIIMSQVSKQIVARSSNTLERSSIKIHRCHHSFIYLLSPLRSATIEKCRNTTVVLGPLETAVHVSNCENLILVAPAHTVLVSGSTLCTLYLMTPTRPVLLSGNDTLLLAPYHTHYPRLEAHLATAGISPKLNLWDTPLCVGPDHRDDQPIWELLPVQEFFTFSIPFEMEGPTQAVPGGLPGRYQRAVTQRHRHIDAWQRMVKEAKLSREQRKEFQALVETRFHVWLAESGHKHELDRLVGPAPSTTKK